MGGGMGAYGAPVPDYPDYRGLAGEFALGGEYGAMRPADGEYGPLESVKIIPDKRHGFVNFVDPADALQLMASTGQQALVPLRGKPTLLQWGKARPGASEAALTAVFSPYGELESVRMVPKKRAAFANYTCVASAIQARERLHGRARPAPFAEAAAAEAASGVPGSGKPLLINFTSSQQNCMRARNGRPPPGLYFGSLPDSAGLAELASLVERYGVVESMRLDVAVAVLEHLSSDEGRGLLLNGKRLTANYAKARAPTGEQLEQYEGGARRKLRLRFRAAAPSESEVKAALGKAEALVCVGEAEAGGEGGEILQVDFASVSAACAAKEVSRGGEGEARG
ncbi:hypothetical protein EMIHUDRAFT_202534 [Emiliania huxleyi CCMP1516]|uniref:RRM domain-containing protein n=2 Tax=Emiliania huxleyi TaxID=2903 RepID=A0A0D3K8C0_EMIH1|nr:hypothetical protein EMIHUDRAFT_202534 [Emiliania huxleyi CCMP1516]EOD32005.1 hypothetical protein EMIHUDRAFT_202534 [Emiliania huxleyi CCMP1516]|eukprot:XP_005784434.1 hypothetical protein EMIHUDRAFT_202534 [Emiliania huxleyi CCMP1516]